MSNTGLSSKSKPTVLIIDDIEDYLRSLENSLKRTYHIITAQSVDAAKEQMGDQIDLVLCDIRLDENDPANRDGLLFLEWSKANYPQIPIIMMSAYREFDLAVDALNLGGDKFFKKPINLVELKSVIATLVSRRKKNRS